MASSNQGKQPGSKQGDPAGSQQKEHSKRGFASMDPALQREIASEGGRAAHEKGTAHEFTSEEARRAGSMSHKNDGRSSQSSQSSTGSSAQSDTGGSRSSGSSDDTSRSSKGASVSTGTTGTKGSSSGNSSGGRSGSQT